MSPPSSRSSLTVNKRLIRLEPSEKMVVTAGIDRLAERRSYPYQRKIKGSAEGTERREAVPYLDSPSHRRNLKAQGRALRSRFKLHRRFQIFARC